MLGKHSVTEPHPQYICLSQVLHIDLELLIHPALLARCWDDKYKLSCPEVQKHWYLLGTTGE